MLEIDNRTPFAADLLPHQDLEGWDHLVVIVKATMQLDSAASLVVAEEQLPLCNEDVHQGEPGQSSVRYESDRCPPKPGTDVILNGHARPLAGRAATQIDVDLQVGQVRQLVRVFGDRQYHRSLGRWKISDPAPFQLMPLTYERAFGGADETGDEEQHSFEQHNPVGTGFTVPRRGRDLEGVKLPNLEDPAALISGPDDHPAPIGFGFIGRHWLPRRQYAGTYDERWQQERRPLAPLDFDARYYNGAHPRLVAAPPLKGGEAVSVSGVDPAGPLRFALPAAGPDVSIWLAGVEQPQPTVLDTVIIEPDERRVVLTWRGMLRVARKLMLIDRIRISGGPT